MTDPGAVSRRWRPDWPCPVQTISRSIRHGPGDPTYRTEPDGTIWRGIRTPAGPATLRVVVLAAEGVVEGIAWGPGAEWVLEHLPAMHGAQDDPTGFEPLHERVAQAWRRHPHWRVPRTGLVMESLVPAVIEQKVTGQEAFAGFRGLVLRHGEAAPGPGAALGLRVQPSPATLRAVPSWAWLHMHIDHARSRTIVEAARVADALERTAGLPHQEADRRLRTLPGIGVWTSAEVRSRAHGDPDAVSFGDYHVAKDIGWALSGAPVDDAGLAVLLEPYRPHRLRVQALLALDGARRPRRGPRMAPRRHLPTDGGSM